jgi:exopolyphosphatase/guanosine-5'-triphosphate,3'-diphosphate pyrophosphatase
MPASGTPSVRLAAIDLGTVTARLLIADVDDRGIHELERHARITHLGEGLYETGRVGAAAIERELAACADFFAAIQALELREGRPVERVVAVATSAMREAQNSDEVIGALRERGLEVEVISGVREARLSFAGTLSGFAADGVLTGQTVLTVDVGGGSTELICGGADAPAAPIEQSFAIGSRRVTDLFLNSDPPSSDELARAARWTRDGMREYFEALDAKPSLMIAVAGTATTTVSVRDKMLDYDPAKIHGARVTALELDGVLSRLASLPLEQRLACPGLEPGRASVIVGGLITLQAALELAALDAFTVSETDILHGILLDCL